MQGLARPQRPLAFGGQIGRALGVRARRSEAFRMLLHVTSRTPVPGRSLGAGITSLSPEMGGGNKCVARRFMDKIR